MKKELKTQKKILDKPPKKSYKQFVFNRIYKDLKVTRRDAQAIYFFMLEYLKTEIIQGREVYLTGIGSILAVNDSSSIGKKVVYTVYFQPAKDLLRLVRSSDERDKFARLITTTVQRKGKSKMRVGDCNLSFCPLPASRKF